MSEAMRQLDIKISELEDQLARANGVKTLLEQQLKELAEKAQKLSNANMEMVDLCEKLTTENQELTALSKLVQAHVIFFMDDKVVGIHHMCKAPSKGDIVRLNVPREQGDFFGIVESVVYCMDEVSEIGAQRINVVLKEHNNGA